MIDVLYACKKKFREAKGQASENKILGGRNRYGNFFLAGLAEKRPELYLVWIFGSGISVFVGKCFKGVHLSFCQWPVRDIRHQVNVHYVNNTDQESENYETSFKHLHKLNKIRK
jgi:hypothetical protein